MSGIAFWYDFASPYSYPAAMRVEEAAAARGVTVTWEPFVLGPIFAAKGLTTSPMKADPVKGAYAWRDLERTCRRLDLPFRGEPPGFPQNGVLAARIALVLDEAARPGFSRAVYTAQFADGAMIADAGVLAGLLETLGLSADLMARAADAENKPLLRAQTERAEAAGVFGAPSFVTEDGELFWGHDRMDEALAWAAARN
jgi:2-hydroxychromene-2-carboxylate isomerase